MKARSRNHCCCGKSIIITYSECAFVVFAIQHAKRMRRIILSSAACPAVPYLSTISYKRHDFRGVGGWGGMLLHIKCFDFLYNFCLKYFSLSYIYVGVHVKYPLFLSGFNDSCSAPMDGFLWNLILRVFSKICGEKASFIKSQNTNGYFTWRPM
jgi:hypothetical protein